MIDEVQIFTIGENQIPCDLSPCLTRYCYEVSWLAIITLLFSGLPWWTYGFPWFYRGYHDVSREALALPWSCPIAAVLAMIANALSASFSCARANLGLGSAAAVAAVASRCRLRPVDKRFNKTFGANARRYYR